MPIKVPDNLPALETLSSEGVDLITEQTAARQDIRPLRLLLLNLMPKKKDTEVQFARLFGNSPLQVDMLLMTTASYTPRNTEPEIRERTMEGLATVTSVTVDKVLGKIKFPKFMSVVKYALLESKPIPFAQSPLVQIKTEATSIVLFRLL